MDIKFEFTGDGIARLTAAIDTLAGPRKVAALRRALNHTGDKCFTAVKRTIAKQMGVTQSALTSNGRGLRRDRATNGGLEYKIVSNGKAMRATEFRFTVSKGNGVVFYPWGKAHHVRRGFMIKAGSKWGTGIKRFDGLYYRVGPGRYNFKTMRGPNINKELVKDTVAATFKDIAGRDLVARVEHEVRVMTDGIVS